MYQQSEIVTQLDRNQLQQQQVDPNNPELKRKNSKIKSMVEVKVQQVIQPEGSNIVFNKLNFDLEAKPQLKKSIVLLQIQFDKKTFNNPIQIKIIQKAEEVIKQLVDFDDSMGKVAQGSFHFNLRKTNLSQKLSEISMELNELYKQAKSQALTGMTELNHLIQNMLQGEIYSQYCQDILTAFASQNFRFQCSTYLAVEYL